MDRFEKVKQLGRGAFGVAFLVESKDAPGQQRVVKQVDLTQLSATARREAQTEIEVLARCKHQNIVEYFDAFVEDLTLHIVMEYADGGDMAAALRRRKEEGTCGFVREDSLTVLAQCAQALQHIHRQRIVHRDIKCQNVFLSAAGSVKLGDFGISKVLDHTASAAKTVIGTPNYLAPEVCESLPYGSKADIWSLGVVLYELLTLQQPFQAHNIAALVIKIITAEPAPLPDTCGEDVQELVTCILRKVPEERPDAGTLLNRPEVRFQVGEMFQPFATRPSRRRSRLMETKESSAEIDFWLPDGSPREELSQSLMLQQEHDDDAEVDKILEGTLYGRPAAALTATTHTEKHSSGRQLAPSASEAMMEELRINREQARLFKARAEGTHGSSIFGTERSTPSRANQGFLVPPETSACSSRPGSRGSNRGGRSRTSSPREDTEVMGLVARISHGEMPPDCTRRPSTSRPISEITGRSVSTKTLFPPDREIAEGKDTGFVSGVADRAGLTSNSLSRPASQASLRPRSGHAASSAAAGANATSVSAASKLPSQAELAEKFTWAAKYQNANLADALWAGSEDYKEDIEKKDSLDKIFTELARLSDEDFRPGDRKSAERGRGGGETACSAGGTRLASDSSFQWNHGEFTESWDAAHVFNQTSEATQQEVTICNEHLLAAHLR